MKRHGVNLNTHTYDEVKEANLNDILKKQKLWRQEKGQLFPGGGRVGGEGWPDRAQRIF